MATPSPAQGPSDALIGLDSEGAVYGVTLGRSWDNQRYADYVRNDRYFREKHRVCPSRTLPPWTPKLSGRMASPAPRSPARPPCRPPSTARGCT